MTGLVRKTPVLLPAVSKGFLKPEYWLRKQKDVEIGPCFAGVKPGVAERIAAYRRMVRQMMSGTYYDLSGSRFDWEPWQRLDATLDSLPGLQSGLIVAPAELKILPQKEVLLSDGRVVDLDRNQISGLDPGDWCIVFAATPGEKWYGVLTRQGTGWVPEKAVALCSKTEVDSYWKFQPRLMVLDPAAKVFTNGGTLPISMGSSLPVKNFADSLVVLPQRGSDGKLRLETVMLKGQFCMEKLPATRYNLIRQAFQYLGYRYAWGDFDCEGRGRDCSRVVQDAFSTLGLKLPRYSQEQLAAGLNRIDLAGRGEFERRELLECCGLGDLLFTNSHVLIFLGKEAGRYYALHAFYKYQAPVPMGEVTKTVKQVVVSDLSPGEGTSTGSLLQRLTGVVSLLT